MPRARSWAALESSVVVSLRIWDKEDVHGPRPSPGARTVRRERRRALLLPRLRIRAVFIARICVVDLIPGNFRVAFTIRRWRAAGFLGHQERPGERLEQERRIFKGNDQSQVRLIDQMVAFRDLL